MKRQTLTPEQRKARLKPRVIPTGKDFAAALRPGELYLKIHAVRTCRLTYECQPIEAEAAFTEACRLKLIEPKKAIGLNLDTTAYSLVDQKSKLVEKPEGAGK